MNFDIDQLVDDCQVAFEDPSPTRAVRDVVSRAVSNTSAVVKALGQPARAEVQRLHVSDNLTILNVIWAPRMTIRPHNHNMVAVIGVYGGREDNIFWRRRKDGSNGLVEAAGAKSLGPQDVCPLGPEIIHSVTNPTAKFTGAIHVYRGDFFAVERSEWEPDDLLEHPYDIEKTLQLFEDANKYV